MSFADYIAACLVLVVFAIWIARLVLLALGIGRDD